MPSGFVTPAAGGGSSPFTRLGPYTVTHSDLDPVSAFDLGALANGTIVWQVAIFVRQLFTTIDEVVGVLIGAADGSTSQPLLDINPRANLMSAAIVAAFGNSLPTGAAYTLPNGAAYGHDTGFVGLAQHSAHLLAYDQHGGNSAGSVDIYALVSVP